jgi:flagellar biosynthesis anti-sigma factor FlgM
MKINQSSLDSTQASQLNKAHETTGIGSGGTGKNAQVQHERDRVQLSELSARLLALADARAPERAARVEKLSADVRSGKYQVDSHDLSSRLIDEAIRQ